MNFLKKIVKRLRKKSAKKAKTCDLASEELFDEDFNESFLEIKSDKNSEEDIIDPQECVDDLELGEEAWTFNLRQQIASMANYSTPQHMGSFYHQPTPSLSFFEKQGLPPLAPLMINNQPNVPGMPSVSIVGEIRFSLDIYLTLQLLWHLYRWHLLQASWALFLLLLVLSIFPLKQPLLRVTIRTQTTPTWTTLLIVALGMHTQLVAIIWGYRIWNH